MIVRQTHDNKIRCINIGEEAEDEENHDQGRDKV